MLFGLKRRQLFIFITAWVTYGSTYLVRKPHGVVKSDIQADLGLSISELGWMDTALILPYAAIQVKSDIQADLGLSISELGWMDTALILPYAAIQMFLGQLIDVCGARRTFALALLLAGFSMISFGSWTSYPILLGLLFMNGAAESLCWPSCTKVLGSWFQSAMRNSVFGLIGTCGYVGGILSTTLTVLLQSRYGWRRVFFIPSSFCICMAMLVWWTFEEASEVKDNSAEDPSKSDSSLETLGSPSKTRRKISWFTLWTFRLVPELAVAVFCLKLVRYAIYLWMPMYLLHHLHYSQTEAGLFSTMFEIGGIVGCLLIGLLINRCFGGHALVGSTVGFILCTLSLVGFILTSHSGVWINSGFMLLVGALNCGPDTMLAGSIPYEIGEKEHSAAAVAGLVNGFGTLGSVVQGPLIGHLVEQYGWSTFFSCLTLTSAVGSTMALLACLKNKQLTDTT